MNQERLADLAFCLFFVPAEKIIEWRLPPTVEWNIVSDFYWLKTTCPPPPPSLAPVAKSTVSRVNGARGPGRQLPRCRAPPILLTPAYPFLKRWGPLPVLRRRWFACTVTSDESSWSGVSFWSCHEWLYYRIAPKIIATLKPYHGDNVGTVDRVVNLSVLSTKRLCLKINWFQCSYWRVQYNEDIKT